MLPKSITLGLILVSGLTAMAQNTDSLLNQLNAENTQSTVSSTFKSTRVVLSHSIETQKKHDLDLRIRHHFGDIGGDFGDSHTLFGLDVASDLHIGLDYGITNNLTLGVGRSKKNELYNAFLKQRVLKQNNTVPVSATLLAQGGWITRKEIESGEFTDNNDRSSYFIQAIIAKRFSELLSLEVLPGMLIRSQTEDPMDEKELFTLGFAGRLKLNKRFSFVADYQWVNLTRSNQLAKTYYNPLGIGLEIETGGHIFSLNFMNSEYIIENNLLPGTTKSWSHGGVRFGFTISRNFTLYKSKNPDIDSKIY